MADPVTLGVLGVLGIVALRRVPQVPAQGAPPHTLPPGTPGSPVDTSGMDSLGGKGGMLGAALAGAVVGYQVVKSLDGKVFNNSGENKTTATIAPWVGAAGGAAVGLAVYGVIAGTIAIPVAGEIIIVAAVIVLAVISVADMIESTINNARKLQLYNQIYGKCAVDPRGAWQIAQDAYTKEGFGGLGFKVGIWALSDGESVFDNKGNAYNVKETMVAAYCQSRATGDAFADVCAQAMPWFGSNLKDHSPFKCWLSDTALNDIRTLTKGMTKPAELRPLFAELYAVNAGRLPATMIRDSIKTDYRPEPTKVDVNKEVSERTGGYHGG